MWVMVFYDLPMLTKKDKKAYSIFRKYVQKDGFQMFQFSVYVRYCHSDANALTHIKRVKAKLPARGKIVIMSITDYQFDNIEIFCDTEKEEIIKPDQQLELF